ncbi:uncharacterized protein F5891DRAFT_737153 [Suillus fuscotomentosus]|uniref:NmrA-like domain-containing protein n=1 Tax=Suillus fuscotomentosus TaxID=1912939 RepID=A0AAD4HEX2_9AGAM|nr:uncharacterized protein F5891DRAFT_736259 [Suillus fuscotomentosus]XP_041219652.1 uncharacterized protein F5891DRAFT_737153 [Suillus fuscotomentosus]KAG1894073.1 hypothetical protein F5891DRAFT_736259 [Suillus fuscotomentosus]KAG1894076.1 hypothetical protein F5891DRAFT_737153 [Suillus fuscotomentosus]
MSEALFKSFAIVGAGPHIGIPVVKAFLAIGTPVLVIARPTSKNTSALPNDDPNPKVVRADYTSASEVSAILRENKMDVLISTVTFFFEGVVVQDVLADAAKEAGVKLFAPSEFGVSPPTPVRLMRSFVSYGNESNICSNPSSITTIVSFVIAPAVYVGGSRSQSRRVDVTSSRLSHSGGPLTDDEGVLQRTVVHDHHHITLACPLLLFRATGLFSPTYTY